RKATNPSLRGAIATKQSNFLLAVVFMDCFAALAMTRDGLTLRSLPHPFRRALFRKRLRSLDIILRRRHRLHGGVFALLGDRLLQRDREAFLNGLLGGADRHRRILADGF